MDDFGSVTPIVHYQMKYSGLAVIKDSIDMLDADIESLELLNTEEHPEIVEASWWLKRLRIRVKVTYGV